MGSNNSTPRGFPEATRQSIWAYLNLGYRGVTMDVYIDGKMQTYFGLITELSELADLVKRCEGRKVRVEDVKFQFIGITCDYGVHMDHDGNDYRG
jgi:hypothetical protein